MAKNGPNGENGEKWPKIANFEKFNFWILAKIWIFYTKTPPKTAEISLNWAKMAQNELCFDSDKKKFWKFFENVSSFLCQNPT